MSPPAVVCIGGAAVDRTYRTTAPLRAGTSNPATGTLAFGGVARNVAETLAHLGVGAALVSRIGADESGLALRRHLDGLGVDTRALAIAPERRTAEYVAVLGPDGELAFGLADMGILEDMDILEDTAPCADPAVAGLAADADWVLADCNLPADTLGRLLRRAGPVVRRLAVDAVSVAKVRRLPPDLSGLDLLFLNADEAGAILGSVLVAGREAQAAQSLRERGVGAVVLTLGARGALVAEPDGVTAVPAVPTRVVDVTGAGDTLVAATLAGLVSGLALPEAVRQGARAAAFCIAWPGSVRPDLATRLASPAGDVEHRLG